ncbi:MAG: hypothetical protein ACI8XO_004550, partial [Verrucomicrobiales bacterium]
MAVDESSPVGKDTESLIQRYLDEDLDAEGFARLQAMMKEDSAVRHRYLAATESVTLLREAAEKVLAEGNDSPVATSIKPTSPFLIPALLACATLVLLLAVHIFRGAEEPELGARIVESSEANGLSSRFAPGDALPVGSRLQLASGSVEIAFESGASTRVYGSALFEIESDNRGLLHYGKVFSLADTEASEGFTIRTASGAYVDRGTEFITQASADGYSQMFVVKGAVDAESSGFSRRRVFGGNGIGFEPGDKPIMIQIERGSETPAFEFPTIPPPSSEDFASVHQVDIKIDSRGRPLRKTAVAPGSAPVGVLTNGRAQQNHDDPSESFFFRYDTTGYLTFDLGETVPVSHIHTYSWHRNRTKPENTLRAVQRFTVWGTREELPAGLPDSEYSSGWTRIARVDTDVFFQIDQPRDRPPQQA